MTKKGTPTGAFTSNVQTFISSFKRYRDAVWIVVKTYVVAEGALLTEIEKGQHGFAAGLLGSFSPGTVPNFVGHMMAAVTVRSAGGCAAMASDAQAIISMLQIAASKALHCSFFIIFIPKSSFRFTS